MIIYLHQGQSGTRQELVDKLRRMDELKREQAEVIKQHNLPEHPLLEEYIDALRGK